MKMKFKSAAIALVLCLVLQVQAETLLGKVIHVQDGDWSWSCPHFADTFQLKERVQHAKT